jgi:AraC-like DNA-binding protein/quercetin dioxygenase-like cupin family protein
VDRTYDLVRRTASLVVRSADAPRPLFVRAFEYPQGYGGHAHRHRLAQVVYPIRGVVSVRTPDGTRTVTEHSAVAIPPWVDHRVAAHGNASLRSVFVDPDVHPALVPPAPRCLGVSPLLHELITEAGRHYTDLDGDEVGTAAIDLIVRLLPRMPEADRSVWVPRVVHPLLRPIVAAWESDPGLAVDLEATARQAGLSSRHLRRLFKADCGVTISTWRSLHHVQTAMLWLAQGKSVSRVSGDLGYASSSAFIAMFKRRTGRTPGTSRPPRVLSPSPNPTRGAQP